MLSFQVRKEPSEIASDTNVGAHVVRLFIGVFHIRGVKWVSWCGARLHLHSPFYGLVKPSPHWEVNFYTRCFMALRITIPAWVRELLEWDRTTISEPTIRSSGSPSEKIAFSFLS